MDRAVDDAFHLSRVLLEHEKVIVADERHADRRVAKISLRAPVDLRLWTVSQRIQ